MKRYLLAVIFTFIVVALHQFVDIRLFNLDLARAMRESLFSTFNPNTQIDNSVFIFNVGELNSDEIEIMVDSLLLLKPKMIGLNLCHLDQDISKIVEKFKDNGKVVIADCGNDLKKVSLSRIIDEGNRVTHFRSVDNTFESLIVGFTGTENSEELINFIGDSDVDFRNYFYSAELKNLKELVPEFIHGKALLVGYVDNYSSDNLFNYKNKHITPLNKLFYRDDPTPDMYDTVISASIISTITNRNFIYEINDVVRVGILLLFSLINVVVITYVKTKWIIANLLIAVVTFVLLTGVGPFLIVYLFQEGYYLRIDELSILLLITTIFTAVLNIIESNRILKSY